MNAPTTPDVLTPLLTATLSASICRRFLTIPPRHALSCGDGVFDNFLVVVAEGRIGVQPASGITMWFDTGDVLVLTVLRGGRILNAGAEPARCCLIFREHPR